jgi:hypothetical protein
MSLPVGSLHPGASRRESGAMSERLVTMLSAEQIVSAIEDSGYTARVA